MDIALIGSGNVATQMGLAFLKGGHKIVSVFSRDERNAKLLSRKVGGLPYTNISEVPPNADLYLVAISDDILPSLTKNLNVTHGVVVHTCGTQSISLLSHFQSYGVFYPVQTLTREKPLSFDSVPICIEANNPLVLKKLERIATSISDQVFSINTETRKVLHLSAVFLNNFCNHLFAISAALIREKNLSFDLLKPLLMETTQKALYSELEELINNQTGPASRGDVKTIESHEEMLEKHPDYLNIYKAITKSILFQNSTEAQNQ